MIIRSLAGGILLAAFLTPILAGAEDPAVVSGIGPAGPSSKVHGGFEFTEGPAEDGHGNVYFSDIPTNRIYRLATDGRLSVFL